MAYLSVAPGPAPTQGTNRKRGSGAPMTIRVRFFLFFYFLLRKSSTVCESREKSLPKPHQPAPPHRPSPRTLLLPCSLFLITADSTGLF